MIEFEDDELSFLQREIDYLVEKEREEYNMLIESRRGGHVDLALNDQFIMGSRNNLTMLLRLKGKLASARKMPAPDLP